MHCFLYQVQLLRESGGAALTGNYVRHADGVRAPPSSKVSNRPERSERHDAVASSQRHLGHFYIFKHQQRWKTIPKHMLNHIRLMIITFFGANSSMIPEVKFTEKLSPNYAQITLLSSSPIFVSFPYFIFHL